MLREINQKAKVLRKDITIIEYQINRLKNMENISICGYFDNGVFEEIIPLDEKDLKILLKNLEQRKEYLKQKLEGLWSEC